MPRTGFEPETLETKQYRTWEGMLEGSRLAFSLEVPLRYVSSVTKGVINRIHVYISDVSKERMIINIKLNKDSSNLCYSSVSRLL